MVQPSSGDVPFPRDRRPRDTERFSNLRFSEAAEVSQLDDLSLAWIDGGQLGERAIDEQQLTLARLRSPDPIVELNPDGAAKAFGAPMSLKLGCVTSFPSALAASGSHQSRARAR